MFPKIELEYQLALEAHYFCTLFLFPHVLIKADCTYTYILFSSNMFTSIYDISGGKCQQNFDYVVNDLWAEIGVSITVPVSKELSMVQEETLRFPWGGCKAKAR